MNTYSSVTNALVVSCLQDGGIGVLPTDTVYGLVAQAVRPEAVSRIFQLKHREHKPGTIIAASIDQLVSLGLKRRYLTAVQQYWPGPVSVVIPGGEGLDYLHQGRNGLAVRLPADQVLQELLTATGPLMTSSANLTGEPTAVTVQQAQDFFGNNVDFYVDGGDLSDRQSSTIVRIVDDAVEVIRQGAATIQ